MTLPELKQALAELESLPVAERTPELVQRAHDLSAQIKRAGRAAGNDSLVEALSTKGLLVHLPLGLHRAFQGACRRKGESMSTVMRQLIRAYVDDEK